MALRWFLPVTVLMACGGGGGGDGLGLVGSGNETPVIDETVNGLLLTDQTFVSRSGAPTPAGIAGAAPTVGMVQSELQFLGDDRVIVTLNGNPNLMITDSAGLFKTPSNDASLFFSHGPVKGVVKDEHVIGLIFQEGASINDGEVVAMVIGEDTEAARVPVEGLTIYEGHGNVIASDAGATGIRVNLRADFDFGHIDGTVHELLYSSPGIVIDLDQTELTAEGFTGTLSSEQFDIQSSEMTGRFFGEDGQSLAGTVLVVSDIVSASGYYLAETRGE